MEGDFASQLDIDLTEVIFPDKRFSHKRVGRKKAFTGEQYLEAVENVFSLNPRKLDKFLGCSYRAIYRFINDPDNKEYVDKAQDFIENIDFKWNRDYDNWDIFFKQPIIQDWYNILRNVKAPPITINKTYQYQRAFWYLCKKLKIHPSKITLEEVIPLALESKRLYYEEKKTEKGLSWLFMREGIRSFFSCIRGISGEFMSAKGTTKETPKTYGKHAKQYISKEVRERLSDALYDIVRSNKEHLELMGLAKFMFYTGTRIGASLDFDFRVNSYRLDNDIWKLSIIDKQRGGKDEVANENWDKYLIGHALQVMKEYFSKRFNILIEYLEKELPRTTNRLFPSFTNSTDTSKIFKEALIKAGLFYEKFMPNHIFRHTFAQAFLRASGWNYKLCASLGGWKSTYVLERAYGSMGETIKLNGLKKARGEKIEETKHEFKW